MKNRWGLWNRVAGFTGIGVAVLLLVAIPSLPNAAAFESDGNPIASQNYKLASNVAEVVTLDEFAAMIASIRDVRNEAAEGYRLDPGVVVAEIEFMREYFETGVIPDPPGEPTPIP